MASPFFSFGPPDVFSTQANTYQNSFGNPINSANMNSGWGIDPSLLTPSYQAPYRPQYSGTQPYNSYGQVGFFSGLNRLYNPLIREPMWGNPIDEMQPSIEGVSSRPFDAAAWAGQRIAAPALAFGAAYRMLGPGSFGGYFTGKGIGAGIGRSIGRGFGSGVAGAFGLRGTAASLVSKTFGGMGSVAGAIGIPLAVAQGALWGGEKALWNPYINTRAQARDLRSNFAGVSFGDATGNAISGGGLGYAESSAMSSQITRAGIQDMTFSTSDYSSIADMSARAGLMDNVKARQITQRVKDVAESIKMIMAISKDPDIRSAIEELSKLNMGGANLTGGSFSVAAGAYQNIGRYAAQAGVSVQRMMSTVGAQGQYLFQANGMTPYLGQLAAGNTMAGFAAAQRVGLMNPAMLARMGGIEGATQASLTGQIAAVQTPYNMMGLYNQYISGAGGRSIPGQGQGVVNTVSTFGQAAARDPLGAIGGLTLYGRQMAGRQLASQGSSAVENQIVSLMEISGVRRGANGKYTAEQMVPFLQQAGMNQDEILAFIAQRGSESDPTTLNQRMRGSERFSAEQMRQTISQDFAYGGILGRGIRGIRQAGRDLTSGIADSFVGPVVGTSGSIADSLNQFTDWLQFGSTIGDGLRITPGSNLFASKTNTEVSLISPSYGSLRGGRVNRNRPNQTSRKIIEEINKMAKEGDPAAIAFLQIKDPSERRSALGQLIRDNKGRFGDAGAEVLGSNNPESFDQLLNVINASDRSSYRLDAGIEASDRVTGAFARTVGTDMGFAESMQAIGGAYEISKLIVSDKIGADNIGKELSNPRYAALRKLAGDRQGGDLVNFVKDVVRRGAKEGTLGISNDALNTGATLDAYKKTNGSQISDPRIREKFVNAKNDDERNQAILEDMASQRGGSVLNNTLKNAENENLNQVLKIVDPMIGADEQRRKLMELVKSGRVDFSTAMQTINSLDDQKNTEKFSGAVDKFADAVDQMNKSSSSGSDLLTWPAWAGGRDNSKQSGPTGPNTR